MSEQAAQTTLRDELTAAFDAQEPAQEAAPQQQQEDAIRARDDKGRFLSSDPDPVAEEKPVEAAPEAPQIKRPSSWKKEMWEAYDKAEPGLRDYIFQREQEMSAGIQPLRAELEAMKPLNAAIQPFMPELQQFGISPTEWIQRLGNAHRQLAMGSPQDRISTFQRLAAEYGVPLESLVQQGGQQHAPTQDPQVQWLSQQVNQLGQGWQQFQSQIAEAKQNQMMQDIQAFAADPAHAHFSTVRDTMAEILQSGMASDLKTAYDKAIRLHDDVWQQEQKARADAEAAQRIKQQAEAAAKAKAHAVSPRSSSPSGSGTAKPTDRRASLMDAFSAHEARV